ncbi:MAG: PIG-L family deacetylase [Bdellovibrionales bacterium]|nr:PIG-L family deacetylase [Bdellovibrionales bacterium]
MLTYSRLLFLFLVAICFPSLSFGDASTSSILKDMQKLSVLGRVLYIGAHPDDENTRVITYLSRGRLYDVAYLSLTRGSGGQNLIGKERGAPLGVIRSQELLAARHIDGAKQFFTRAIDFGFSKTPEETFEHWERETLLQDVVRIIRDYQPDILITRFPTEGPGHGHHTASALLAGEAFEKAGDANFSPGLGLPWQPARLFLNLPHWTEPSEDLLKQSISIDVGKYDSILGRSYGEIAAEARTMHKSQGFGSAPERGSLTERFVLLKGSNNSNDLMEGIDTSWKRLERTIEIENDIRTINREFAPEAPWKIVPHLAKLKASLRKLESSSWKESKIELVNRLLENALGLTGRFSTDSPLLQRGESFNAKLELIQRSPVPVRIHSVTFRPELPTTVKFNEHMMLENVVNETTFSLQTPRSLSNSNAPWLLKESVGDFYGFDKIKNVIQPKAEAPIHAVVTLEVHNEILPLRLPLTSYTTDRVRGEVATEAAVVPKIAGSLSSDLLIFSGTGSKTVTLELTAQTQKISGTVHVAAPKGWRVEPNQIFFSLNEIGGKQFFQLTATPTSLKSESGSLSFTYGSSDPLQSIAVVNYPHIPGLTMVAPLQAKLLLVPLNVPASQIGFVPGAGEETPKILSELGMNITEITEDRLKEDLSQFASILFGIRALNTNPWLGTYKNNLLEYVRQGGVLVVQYNTHSTFSPLEVDIWPYPLSIDRGRVTDEKSAVSFLQKEHAVLNFPHKITENDFSGWVQERGLYFVGDADERYDRVLAMNDSGEESLNGSLLVTQLGEGRFVYTGLSFFRQLPEGVPGAYRLLFNLLTLPKKE